MGCGCEEGQQVKYDHVDVAIYRIRTGQQDDSHDHEFRVQNQTPGHHGANDPTDVLYEPISLVVPLYHDVRVESHIVRLQLKALVVVVHRRSPASGQNHVNKSIRRNLIEFEGSAGKRGLLEIKSDFEGNRF